MRTMTSSFYTIFFFLVAKHADLVVWRMFNNVMKYLKYSPFQILFIFRKLISTTKYVKEECKNSTKNLKLIKSVCKSYVKQQASKVSSEWAKTFVVPTDNIARIKIHTNSGTSLTKHNTIQSICLLHNFCYCFNKKNIYFFLFFRASSHMKKTILLHSVYKSICARHLKLISTTLWKSNFAFA